MDYIAQLSFCTTSFRWLCLFYMAVHAIVCDNYFEKGSWPFVIQYKFIIAQTGKGKKGGVLLVQ
jgi:hypothetical protein